MINQPVRRKLQLLTHCVSISNCNSNEYGLDKNQRVIRLSIFSNFNAKVPVIHTMILLQISNLTYNLTIQYTSTPYTRHFFICGLHLTNAPHKCTLQMKNAVYRMQIIAVRKINPCRIRSKSRTNNNCLPYSLMTYLRLSNSKRSNDI